jgi:hypothetical protein
MGSTTWIRLATGAEARSARRWLFHAVLPKMVASVVALVTAVTLVFAWGFFVADPAVSCPPEYQCDFDNDPFAMFDWVF